MKALLVLGAAVALAILAACGEGADGGRDGGDLLHLRESDISEAAYRNLVRAMLLEPGAIEFCQGIQGLSPQEVVEVSGTPNPEATALAGSTAMPGQTPDVDDLEQAARIMQEECDRILRP